MKKRKKKTRVELAPLQGKETFIAASVVDSKRLKEPKRTTKTLSLNDEVYDDVKARCGALGVPISTLVDALLYEWLQLQRKK